jgi:cobalt-precorrin 5A hydrolase/precorrin-3B C17-methyltransferase
VTGIVYGLGIGPGDPDLITVKARDVLARVPVVAYPAPEGGTSLVRAIAAPHVPAGRIEIVLSTPMTTDRYPALDVYDRAAENIAAHTAAGRDVAVLCEGDPFLYGSFMYLYERLAARCRVEVVPGVSSLGAVAAAAGVPLAAGNATLLVLPAPLPESTLAKHLAAAEAAVIVKVGRHLAKVRRVLGRLGRDNGAVYVERATMAGQRVAPLAAIADDAAPYFSAILVPPAVARQPRAALAPAGCALVALTAEAGHTASRLRTALPGSSVHGLAGRIDGAEVAFTDTASHLRRLFATGTPIVGVCAAGILIRALATVIADKRQEPPVLAVAEDGSAVVPLLGGHHGGHALTRAVAAALGAFPAITAAGDLRLGFAVDDPPPGWRMANPGAAKAVSAALLAGEPVALRVEAGDAGWLRGSGAPFAADAGLAVTVSDRADAATSDGTSLVLRPPVLAVGVGCERNAAPDPVVAFVLETLDRHGLARDAVSCVASLDLKADEPAVHAVASALGVPARFFTADELEAEAPRLVTPSATVFREVGCHGVAEGAALAAAGAEAVLAVAKTKGPRATCAVARARRDIVAADVGQPRGRLAVVGLGPGCADWRTPEATRVLSEATDVVGLQLYLDLAKDLVAGKACHATLLSEETARARLALELAAGGRAVALVSSGDAGIYGMASLVFELLEREPEPAWRRIAVTVVPGLSALQAAAARIGAPLGHDFCAVSLSDLLTPWPDIERRLRAAADGDFVVALYNPVSKRRTWQLAAARDILLAGRPPETPVVLARNLGREGERIDVVALADLEPGHADMLTLVVVGSSHTRAFEAGGRRWVFTPRGYAAKAANVTTGAAS